MTNSEKTAHSGLLIDLLSTIRKKWGTRVIYSALEAIVPERERIKLGIPVLEVVRHQALSSPIKQVDDLNIDVERKSALLRLADDFEKEIFLRTYSDVKRFLTVRGMEVPNSKSRPVLFKTILPLLSDLPVASIEREQRRGSHSGPAKLGPLAEAIRDSGAQRRANRLE